MKVVVQRVKKATVKSQGKVFSEIGKGYLALVGFCCDDNQETILKMVDKLANLRLMADEKGKMNYDLKTARSELLIVSQFTLCADTSQRRPSFIKAMRQEEAKRWYEFFIEKLKEKGLKVKKGRFGSFMEVELVNEGPVTIVLES